jgi:hypothetical protein
MNAVKKTVHQISSVHLDMESDPFSAIQGERRDHRIDSTTLEIEERMLHPNMATINRRSMKLSAVRFKTDGKPDTGCQMLADS